MLGAGAAGQSGCSEAGAAAAAAAAEVRKGDLGPPEAGPGTRVLVGLESWLCHPLAIGSWTKNFPFLVLSFLVCKMDVPVSNSQGSYQR